MFDFKKKPYNFSKFLQHTGIVVFCAVLLSGALLFVFIPKSGYSELEAKELTHKPEFSFTSFFSGEYTTSYDKYFAENFPFRDTLLKLNARFESLFGFKPNDIQIYRGNNETSSSISVAESSSKIEESSHVQSSSSSSSSSSSTSHEPDQESEPIESSEEPDDDFDPIVDNTWDPEAENCMLADGILVVGNRAMSVFGIGASAGERYANVISKYAEEFPEDVRVFNIIVPTAAEYYVPEKYSSLSQPQAPVINEVYSFLSDEVIAVDACSELEQHTNEYIYFRTDHHWTPLGAYYAYKAFCSAAGFDASPLSSYERKTQPAFTGSMYRYTQNTVLLENPDDFTYLVPSTYATSLIYKTGHRDDPISADVFVTYAKGSNTYSTCLGGDWPLTEITTEANTGKSVVVIKESFGNAFAPYLIDHYDKIYVVDQRYFEKSLTKLVEEKDIDDVIFINNVYAVFTSYHVNCIENLRYTKAYQTSSSSSDTSSSSDSSSSDSSETSSSSNIE